MYAYKSAQSVVTVKPDATTVGNAEPSKLSVANKINDPRRQKDFEKLVAKARMEEAKR